MVARSLPGIAAAVLAVAVAGCGEDVPAAVDGLSQLLVVMRTGAEGALATARPILEADESAITDSWAGEVRRHAAAEAKVHSMLLQGRELLARADLDGVARHETGREVYGQFLDHYERLADAYAGLHARYVTVLEELETEDGVEAGIGRTAESFAESRKGRLADLAIRADEAFARYLGDRARQARLLRIGGDVAAGQAAGKRGQAFLQRHDLVGRERFDSLAAELDTLAQLGG